MSQAKYGKNDINILEQFYVNAGARTQTMVDTLLSKPFENLWWKTKFEKASMPTPLNADGLGIYKVNDVVQQSTAMMSPREPWSAPTELISDGFKFYTGTLGNFGIMKAITDQEKQYYRDMLSEYGGDGVVLKNIIDRYFDLVKGGHATITNLCAQLNSDGRASTMNTTGHKFHTLADISPKQRKKAGAKAWSDPTAKILETMQLYEKEFRDETGYDGALSWKMDKVAFNFIQKNEDARSQIGTFITNNGIAFTTNSIITIDAYNNWVTESSGQYMSPIEIVEEKQILQNGLVHRTAVSGWVEGRAVLSPVGMQGTIEYANVKELSVLAEGADKQVAYLENGLFGMMNWVKRERNNKYITELLATLSPALRVFKHIIFVDTKTAN